MGIIISARGMLSQYRRLATGYRHGNQDFIFVVEQALQRIIKTAVYQDNVSVTKLPAGDDFFCHTRSVSLLQQIQKLSHRERGFQGNALSHGQHRMSYKSRKVNLHVLSSLIHLIRRQGLLPGSISRTVALLSTYHISVACQRQYQKKRNRTRRLESRDRILYSHPD